MDVIVTSAGEALTTVYTGFMGIARALLYTIGSFLGIPVHE
ncbi:hypothetical protein [Corynebacterium terpenotabidum]|nr:hypothetical protein [Corynebacterium terpenotabidum]